MKKYRIMEIICIVILVLFIGILSKEETLSNKTVKEVAKAVTAAVNTEGLKKQKELQIKKEFSFTVDSFDGVYYIKSDDIMDVREILIIRLKENQTSDEAIEKIEKRLKDKQTLFEGYAPEQSAMLKDYCLKQKAGFIFYAVLEEKETAISAFNKIL
ncbi:MAG: DUF4358 domain-containing protein [Clostridia bacterium]|nr:DUF4358 domain-containing protein [Clostridia bacterium]MBR2078795.1 DUF4358 domain-containing protein [Clostridia bacterium]